MRILHTSDWHFGKRIGRFDRRDEYADATDEIVRIADDQHADLIVHSGDLFDKPVPPYPMLDLALRRLGRLAEGRPVVVIAGNHDSPALFDALAGWAEQNHLYLVGDTADAGRCLRVETPSGSCAVAALPFVRATRITNPYNRDTSAGTYADQMRLRIGHLVDEATQLRTDATIFTSHFVVSGALVGSGQRGERPLHMSDTYTANPQALPTLIDYVAMGHIHRPQKIPSVEAAARYAGSLLQCDFGEAGEAKGVVIVETGAGNSPARVEHVPLTEGRRLRKEVGTWQQLAADHTLDDCYLDLTILPDPDADDSGDAGGVGSAAMIVEEARRRFPWLIRARVDGGGTDTDSEDSAPDRAGDVRVLYDRYLQDRGGVDKTHRGRLVELFDQYHQHLPDNLGDTGAGQ